MRAAVKELPFVDMLYFADSAHCPYGRRSPSEVRALSAGISGFLIDHGANLIVVACNTASAAALDALREMFPHVPFVGMVPAVKPAVSLSPRGVIGVLATPVTMRGRLLSDVVQRFSGNSHVTTQVCPGLVEQIEEGRLSTPDTRALLMSCLEPLLRRGIDTLVLGCTHYPFVIPLIRELVGPEIRIVSAAEAVAKQVRRVLEQLPGVVLTRRTPSYRFFTTGGVQRFRMVKEMLVPGLGGPVEQVPSCRGVRGEGKRSVGIMGLHFSDGR